MRIIIYFYIVGVCSVFIKIKFDFFDYFFVDWQIMEYVLIINVICWGKIGVENKLRFEDSGVSQNYC